jgi:serine/threonine protein kinase
MKPLDHHQIEFESYGSEKLQETLVEWLSKMDFSIENTSKIIKRFPTGIDLINCEIDDLLSIAEGNPLAITNLYCILTKMKRNDTISVIQEDSASYTTMPDVGRQVDFPNIHDHVSDEDFRDDLTIYSDLELIETPMSPIDPFQDEMGLMKVTPPKEWHQWYDDRHRKEKFIRLEDITFTKNFGNGLINVCTYFGEEFVIKRILKSSKELEIILKFDDPCLMKCQYWSEDQHYFYCLMERMETTLKEALHGSSYRLSEVDKFKIVRDVVHGLKVLHAGKVLHRELSSWKILLKRNKSGAVIIKITDFATLPTTQWDKQNTKVNPTSSLHYRPLDFLEDPFCKPSTNVYAFGVILFELIFEEVPWKGYTWEEIVERMELGDTLTTGHRIPTPWLKKFDKIRKILDSCFDSAEKRMSFAEIETILV